MLGLTDVEIGFLIGVSERTINRYKKDAQFLSALKKGKLTADAQVVKSLFKRASGYEYKERTQELRGRGKRAVILTTKIVTKHVVPDVLACNSWLNNRRRDQWTMFPKPGTGFSSDEFDKLRQLVNTAMADES